jgi:hypothetical protein
VIIIAARDIAPNEEIRYDYGGGQKNLPWREVSNTFQFHLIEVFCLRKVQSFPLKA